MTGKAQLPHSKHYTGPVEIWSAVGFISLKAPSCITITQGGLKHTQLCWLFHCWLSYRCFSCCYLLSNAPRSWDTKICAPCPRGFYSTAASGYTPAKITSSASANATAAAAAVNATAAAAAPAATVGTSAAATAAPSPATTSATTAAAVTAGQAPAAAARTAQSQGTYTYGPKPRAQLCDRCLSEENEAGGLLTPKEGTTDPEECGCAAGGVSDKVCMCVPGTDGIRTLGAFLWSLVWSATPEANGRDPMALQHKGVY